MEKLIFMMYNAINQSNYLIVCLKVNHRAGQLGLPHIEITKTEKYRTEQISPVNGLQQED